MELGGGVDQRSTEFSSHFCYSRYNAGRGERFALTTQPQKERRE
jgi:hypothetical protein